MLCHIHEVQVNQIIWVHEVATYHAQEEMVLQFQAEMITYTTYITNEVPMKYPMKSEVTTEVTAKQPMKQKWLLTLLTPGLWGRNIPH